MSRSSADAGRLAGLGRAVSAGWMGALAVLGAGILLGMQYAAPDKRVIAVIAAALVFGIAWRLSMVMGIGLLMLTLPFPRGVVFGNTNMAFILLLLVIWLLRHSTRTAPAPRPTPLDAPIIALTIAYLVSFYNVTDPSTVRFALQNFFGFIACACMYYLIVSNVNGTADLRRIHAFYLVSMLMIYGATVFELLFPGHALVPGWITLGGVETEGVAMHQRVGGPFFDYELLSEYAALNVLLMIFFLAQARSVGRKTLFAGLLVFTVFILFATVTRGALVSLGAGLLYLGWLLRRRLQVVPLTITLVTCTVGVLMMEFYITHFTNAGSIFDRFAETKFVGYIPDSRAEVWPRAFERFLHHPIIGWGPFYATRIGLDTWTWPHDIFLYVANCLGIVGLACFVWLLWRLWRSSRPDTDWLGNPSYARAFVLIAHVQLVTFLVNEIKIDYLRNPIYQYVVWVYFSVIVAGWKVARMERAAQRTAPAPTPDLRAA